MDRKIKKYKQLVADDEKVRLYIRERLVKIKERKTKDGRKTIYRVESYMIDPPKKVIEICKKRGWIK